MYDVIYLDQQQREHQIASGLDRSDAVAVATERARELGVGRMFACGSGRQASTVLIVGCAPAEQGTAAPASRRQRPGLRGRLRRAA